MDFNNDGIRDILSGSYPGELYFFPGNSDGAFGDKQTIKGSNGEALKAGMAAAPFAVDWNEDGKLDLIIGTIDGNVVYVPNTGSSQKPEYKNHSSSVWLSRDSVAKSKPLTTVKGDAVKVGSDAGPTVADWNGDGIPDLIVGSGDGSVVVYLANGRNDDKTPMLSAPVTLLPAGMGSEANHPWGIRTKPFVADYNGDGRPDLLVGDFQANEGMHGYVWLFLRKSQERASAR